MKHFYRLLCRSCCDASGMPSSTICDPPEPVSWPVSTPDLYFPELDPSRRASPQIN